MSRMRLRPVAAVVALALLSVLAPARPAAAAVPDSFAFRGAGWGHGVGMSQWGAYGQAKEGRSAADILGHYYRGTALRQRDDRVDVRVNLISDTTRAKVQGKGGEVVVAIDGKALAGPVAAGNPIDLVMSGDKISVSTAQGPLGTGATVHFFPKFLLEVVGPTEGYDFARPGHEYRYGFVDARVSQVGTAPHLMQLVNQLKVFEYMKGLAEVPSSWPVEALKAQAIAGRTYAHRAISGQQPDFNPCRCHLFDTVQSQVYEGWTRETPPWVAAADGTLGTVVTHNEKLATTLYSSSTGGRTQNTSDRFGGSTAEFPYLTSVDDRWSLIPDNPYSSWEYVKTQGEVAAAFGLPDVARLDLSDRTAGQALRTATAHSSGGATATITGGQFVERLGLRARWVGTPVVRLAGGDRYATSVTIGKVAVPTSTTAVIVSGEAANLVDGLVAAPLARLRVAPILLTQRSFVPAPLDAELRRRGTRSAVIVGGIGAVGPEVETVLRARGITVTRIAGGDRYDTAARVAAQMGNRPTAVVASGANANLVDALAAGAPAASAGHPILLTAPDHLPEPTRVALRDRGVTATKVAGGESAVSEAVVRQLPGPIRLAGDDRYSTATAVATHYDPIIGSRNAAVASGANANLVDALPGGALGGLLVLTEPGALPATTGSWLATRTDAFARVHVLGGRNAITDATFDAVRGAVYP